MNILSSIKNLTKGELILWFGSLIAVTASFLCSEPKDFLSLTASLIGVTGLIFVAKGDVLGQIIIVIFSLFYAVISYTFNYYGEMITYLFMSAPIAVLSVVTWLKNPYGKHRVKINAISGKEVLFMFAAAFAVTTALFFVLRYFETPNLLFSSISVATSFLASYLMLRRSPFYAAAYAANDIVLIILWIAASMDSSAYIPMVVCFFIFFVNDAYGFVNWLKMHKIQTEKEQ